MRRRLSALAALLGLVAVLVSAPPALAAAPAPAWSVTGSTYPTNVTPGSEFNTGFGAGPAYRIVATNVGGAPTSGSFTVTDTLPSGLVPVSTAISTGTGYGHPAPAEALPLDCKITGQTFTCTGGFVKEGPNTVERPLGPGESARVTIPVNVTAAPGTVSNEATVEGGGAAAASTRSDITISSDPAAFGFLAGSPGLFGTMTNADGSVATQAGSHPYQQTIGLGWPVKPTTAPSSADLLAVGGGVRDLAVSLPSGMVVNPQATGVRCKESELEAIVGQGGCPDASQVGVATLSVSALGGITPAIVPIYSMVPAPGTPGELAFEVLENIYVHLRGKVKSNGDYEISTIANNILAKIPVAGAQAMLWGNPSDASHDRQRGACLKSSPLEPCAVPRSTTAFLTLPSACSGPLRTTARTSSWLDPAASDERSFDSADPQGNPVGVDGCNKLEFDPQISSQPTTNHADSPSGLDFSIHLPQNEDFDGLATANLKDVRLTLPDGMTLNPSAADGLEACTEAQIGYQPFEGKVRFSETPQSCPDAAKVGTVEVSTPLLDRKLAGAIYVAQPFENPFGTLLAVYLVIEDEQTGIVAKLAGKATPDPNSGQITSVFTENPQLPLEDINAHFFDGPRAALKTPLACGSYTTTATLTPWSAPGGEDANRSDVFSTSVAASGAGACPKTEAAAPHKPSFTAGTTVPKAGAYAPFVLKLSRDDGSQLLTGLDVTLPKGLTGKLAGIPSCSEAQIAQAQGRDHPNQGALERQSPSCPKASEVGVVNVGAGPGITPLYVQGHVYWAGPYKGAPLSVVVITPAVAGPFDLGTVVVRIAFYVNSETAQIHAVSDPLPKILQGIPLDLRSVAAIVDRPDFTLNPTSCDPTTVTGTATAATGQTAALSSPFQVGGCSALKFAPHLAISLKGGTKRNKNPALKAVATYPKGAHANIAAAQVTLPHSEFLDQSHIGTVCTRVQFAVDQCPKRSIYGYARAITPLLDKPVEGPVYLRSSSHPLPDLVAALDGQIDVDVVGRVDTGKGGGIRNTFEAAPDAPVTKFVIELRGGKRGILVNSENICRKPQRATVKFTGHNGKVSETTPLIKNSCKGKKKAHGKKKGRGGRR